MQQKEKKKTENDEEKEKDEKPTTCNYAHCITATRISGECIVRFVRMNSAKNNVE